MVYTYGYPKAIPKHLHPYTINTDIDAITIRPKKREDFSILKLTLQHRNS